MTDQIQREVDLPLSLGEAWAALIGRHGLEGWLADEVEIELVPGGGASFREGEVTRTGWVEEVTPPAIDGDTGGAVARLAFWWCVDDEPASRVELSLVAVDGELTRLRVVEARPLELLDLVGIPLGGGGRQSYGPALLAGAR